MNTKTRILIVDDDIVRQSRLKSPGCVRARCDLAAARGRLIQVKPSCAASNIMGRKGKNMKPLQTGSVATRVRFRGESLAGVMAAISLSFAPFTDAGAAAGPLSDADTACLGCHSMEGLAKTLDNGESLSLHVPGEGFAGSVHRVFGCTSCHAAIDPASHPAAAASIASTRQYSIERAAACQMCHADALEQYEGSLHSARVREGHPLAPVCTGCHGAHEVSPRTAYETCVGCHAADLDAHGDWLPNAALHQEVVSCAACHAPDAARMIDLRLYDGAAKQWVVEQEGTPLFGQLAQTADANGDGLDAKELRNLLQEINRGAAIPKTLRGRVELRTDVEAHRLADKSHAIKACDNCHQHGAEPFRNVTVSVTGPDGRPLRYPAHPEILNSTLAVQSLPEFYAIGGTRSPILDALLVLALLAGAGIPAGHLTVKWLFRKYRARRARSGDGNDAG